MFLRQYFIRYSNIIRYKRTFFFKFACFNCWYTLLVSFKFIVVLLNISYDGIDSSLYYNKNPNAFSDCWFKTRFNLFCSKKKIDASIF